MPVFNLTDQSMKYEPSVASARQMETGRLDTTWSGGVGSQDYGRFLEDKPLRGGSCFSLPSLFKKRRSTKRKVRKAQKSRKSRKASKRQQKRR